MKSAGWPFTSTHSGSVKLFTPLTRLRTTSKISAQKMLNLGHRLTNRLKSTDLGHWEMKPDGPHLPSPRLRLSRISPGEVAGARTMARLARHVDIAPAGRISIGGELVVFIEISGEAVGTLVIPGLVASNPVQSIAGRQFLVGIEVKPTLTALIFRPVVPGDAECEPTVFFRFIVKRVRECADLIAGPDSRRTRSTSDRQYG
jgi:hypothetical protein